MLIHNLRIHAAINMQGMDTETTKRYFQPTERMTYDKYQEIKGGKLLCRGTGELYLTVNYSNGINDDNSYINNDNKNTAKNNKSNNKSKLVNDKTVKRLNDVMKRINPNKLTNIGRSMESSKDKGSRMDFTYKDQWVKSHPDHSTYINQLSADPSHVMLTVISLNSRLTLVPLLGQVKGMSVKTYVVMYEI